MATGGLFSAALPQYAEGGALAVPRLFPVGTCEWNSPGLAVPRLFPGLFPDYF